MKCPICGSSEFEDLKGRPLALCKSCRAWERTRLLWMIIDELELPSAPSILHFAPEKSVYDALRRKFGEAEYVCADISPERYKHAEGIIKLDMCNLDAQPSNKYDLIIHSHVLEHIPCNVAYTLSHLHRMLKPDGRHVFAVPFLKGKYDETFQEIGDEQRTKRFGQYDHVRRFGTQDLHSHLGKLVRLPAKYDMTQMFSEERLREANIPEASWKTYNGHSVLVLRKHDFLLGV